MCPIFSPLPNSNKYKRQQEIIIWLSHTFTILFAFHKECPGLRRDLTEKQKGLWKTGKKDTASTKSDLHSLPLSRCSQAERHFYGLGFCPCIPGSSPLAESGREADEEEQRYHPHLNAVCATEHSIWGAKQGASYPLWKYLARCSLYIALSSYWLKQKLCQRSISLIVIQSN